MDYNVMSGDAPEGMEALEIAGRGQRLGAFLVDFLISVVVSVVALAVGAAIGAAEVLNIIVSIGYWIVVLYLVATRGQSPGKMAIGIKIVKTDGTSMGVGSTLVREIIGKLVSGIVILLGYVWILFDGKRQGWHDKIAGTYVVKV